MKTENLVIDIIKEQSLIIGEALAKKRAEGTGLVKFNSSKLEDVTLTQSDTGTVIQKLIDSYSQVFGQASIEVCMDVLKKYPAEEIGPLLPKSLQANMA